MGSNEVGLLRAILATVARQTFPPETIEKIVAPQANSLKWMQVYNLCDGSMSQADIAKKVNVDKSDVSKKIKKWIEAGIVIRLADGDGERPVHVYPLPEGGGSGS
jgi:DNA-binding MarR family transcriptional regulator